MLSTESNVPQTAENGNGGKRRTPCPLYGCKRVYADMAALERHIKDHDISTQSLPGKVLLCSTVGCNGSFPNMQELMVHMRRHHKPNIFFLCENCRNKLRSYRGLLTHLHTCSKVPRGKAKSAEPALPALTNPNITPMAIGNNPPQQDSASTPQELPFQIPNPDGSFPAAVPQSDSAAQSLQDPPFLPNQETPPPQQAPRQLAEAVPPPQFMHKAADMPLLRNLVASKPALDPPDAQSQQLTQIRSPGSAPHSPPGPVAVWRKNQGIACSRRVLWEHTKGRYTCVQCGHIVTNRKEMTQHISTQHSGNKAAEDTGSSATNP